MDSRQAMTQRTIIFALVLIAIRCSVQTPETTGRQVNRKEEFQKCLDLLDDKIKQELSEKGTSNDEKYKKYQKCIYVFHGFMNDNGELNEDALKANFICAFRSVKKGDVVYEKCGKKADDPANTAHDIESCFVENVKAEMKKNNQKQ